MTEKGIVLAKMMDDARHMTRFYLSKLKVIDPTKFVVIGETRLNSVYWITAHLSWAQNNLILNNIGGDPLQMDWMKHFTKGSNPANINFEELPPFKKILDDSKKIHAASLELIQNMTTEQFEAENKFGLNFGTGTTNEAIIMHSIRHEGIHGGQLSTIAKLCQIKTV